MVKFAKPLRQYFSSLFAPLRETDAAADLNLTDEEQKSSKRILDYLKNTQAKLRDLFLEAHTHEYTGLANRRMFEKAVSAEIGFQSSGQSSGGAVILMDMDKLHAVNTRYGLAAGDALLKEFAQKLSDVIEDSDCDHNDLACHFGGDEFAVLITNSSPEKTEAIWQQVKSALTTIDFSYADDHIVAGASIGITALSTEDVFSQVMDRADQALKTDKEYRKPSRDAFEQGLMQPSLTETSPPQSFNR